MSDKNLTEEDIKQWKQLNDLLGSGAVNWTVSTPELIKTYRSLVWLANMGAKIEANVMEITEVRQVKPSEEEADE
jgi:hypothetical protein